MKIKAGATNVSVYYYIVQDASGTSPGEPVTGLLFSDIETGGSASYVRQGAASTDLTLITLANAGATHADGGFILVSDSANPGLYRCDYPDAAFATGVSQTFLQIVVASGKNAVAAPILVDIDDNVDQTVDNDTKLTTIAADVANIDGAAMRGTDNAATSAKQDTMETTLNAIPTTAMRGTDGVDTAAMRGTDGANTVVPPSVSQFNARTLVSASYFDFSTDLVTLAAVTHTGAVIPTVSVLTGHTVQTGDSFSRIGVSGVGLADLGGMSTAMKAEVNTEVDTGLTDYDAATGAELAAVDAKIDIIDINVDQIETAVITNAAGVDISADIAALKVDSAAIKVTTDKLTFTVSNQLDSNMLTHTAGIPSNYITSAGIAANALDNKGNWNIDKTGYSLTQGFPSNFSGMSISVGGDVSSDLNKINGVTINGDGSATPFDV